MSLSLIAPTCRKASDINPAGSLPFPKAPFPSMGIDWYGNHRLDGGGSLSAALDLAGLFDPSGVADAANAVLLASEGRC